jgi:polyisoprenoid-binding protein YceI
MIAKVHGNFEKFKGNVNFDEESPTNSSLEIEIEAASLSTGNEQRDGHLRSPDFFDVEQYPLLRFKSKRVEQIDDHNGRIIGDLTIRDVSKEIVLDVEYLGQGTSPWGTVNAGFSAAATINRKDWDLNWNQPLETGGFLVSDKIRIEIDAELIKQD